MYFCICSFYIDLIFFKKKEGNICILYSFFFIIIYNLGNLYYNISIYYQLVNYLNTKNNFIIILMLTLFLLKTLKIFFFTKFFKKILILLLLILIIFSESCATTNLNLDLYNYLEKSFTLSNFNLLNGLMLIHPYILYLFYSFILIIITVYSNNYNKINFNKKNWLFINNHIMFIGLLFIISAIILGCWWAEQELSWGGWWSWDFVELVAFNFNIYILYFLHKSKDTYSYNLNSHNYITITILLLISIISVRFNIINSVHNFVNSDSQYQYNYYLYIIIIMSILHVFMKSFLLNFSNNLKFYFIFLILFFLNIYLYITITSFFKIGFIFKDFYKNINIVSILIIFVILFFNSMYFNISSIVFTNAIVLIFNLFLYFLLEFKLLKQTLICIILLYIFIIIFITSFKNTLYNTLDTVFIIHICIFWYLYKCMLQKYLFYPDCSSDTNIHNLNLNSFKCNNIYLLSNSTIDYLNISVFIEIVTGSVEDFYKTIFEKKLFYNFLIGLIELYNYNYQILVQPILGNIFIIFLFMLSCIVKIIFSKKIITFF